MSERLIEESQATYACLDKEGFNKLQTNARLHELERVKRLLCECQMAPRGPILLRPFEVAIKSLITELESQEKKGQVGG